MALRKFRRALFEALVHELMPCGQPGRRLGWTRGCGLSFVTQTLEALEESEKATEGQASK